MVLADAAVGVGDGAGGVGVGGDSEMAARIQTLGLGPYKTPEVWPGQRREHGPEKPGARNAART